MQGPGAGLVLLAVVSVASPAPALRRAPTAPGPLAPPPADRHPIVEAGPPRPASASGLDADDLVVGVASGGERAYPLSVLWEEDAHTVNDRIGGAPVAIAACPLAGVGTAFDRRRGRDVLELGHLVATRRGSLILYDEESGSHWSLFSGAAYEGPREGQRPIACGGSSSPATAPRPGGTGWWASRALRARRPCSCAIWPLSASRIGSSTTGC